MTRSFFALALLSGLAFMTIGLCLPRGLATGIGQSVLVTDRAGAVLRMSTADDGQYRLWTGLDEYAPSMVEAMLLKEDRLFWIHPGVDPAALVRAAWHGLVLGDYQSGASTITMQMVRLRWGLDTRSLGGKLLQMGLALGVEALVPKAEILELYLNIAPCGGNVQGLGTAARIWLGKAPADLNLGETLGLAVLPQDPAGRNPARPETWGAIEAARARLAADYLALRADQASALRPLLELPLQFRRDLPFAAPHVVTRLLAQEPKRKRLETTIDRDLQELAQAIIGRYVQRAASLGVRNAAAMIVSSDTMEVLASIGSADFFDAAIQGQVDGTRARRSPGSTLKPFIYALAMQQGLIHPLSVLADVRVQYGGYNPDNFDNEFEGPIRAVDALIKSRNVPAVRLARGLAHPDLYDFLGECAWPLPKPREHYGLSLVLGGAEMTMEGLVELYGTLDGNERTIGMVRRLRYLRNDSFQPARRVLSPEAAWLTRLMLATKQRPEQASEPAQLGMRWPVPSVAYKTGTSIGFRDAWSIGIADGLIVAVWVGDFSGASNPEFVGIRAAAPLMFELVEAWRANGYRTRVESMAGDALPEGLVRVPVCAVSGQVATAICPRVAMAPFIAGVSPIASCSVHQMVHVDRISGLRRQRPLPGVTTSSVYEIWPSDIMELFDQAGMARQAPPAMDPDDLGEGPAPEGPALSIVSPVRDLRYLVSASGTGDRLPLMASVPSDAKQLWWFIDGALVARVKRGESWFWKPTAGHHEAKVVDELGRSAEMEFEVEQGE